MDIHALIAGLSSDERRELQAQLAYDNRGNMREISDAERELWDALHDALGIKDGSRRSFVSFVQDYGKAKFANCVDQLAGLLADAIPPITRRPIVMSVRRTVLRCLADHLRAANIPVTPKVMLNSFSMLRYAVDQQYPGYIDARMLHRVAQAFAA